MKIYLRKYFIATLTEVAILIMLTTAIALFPNFYANRSAGYLDEIRRIIMLVTIFSPPIIFLIVALIIEIKTGGWQSRIQVKNIIFVAIRILTFLSFIIFQLFLIFIVGLN